MQTNAPVTPGRWLGMGWDIFKEDVGNFILITLLGLVLMSVGTFLVAGPVTAGFFIAAKRRILDGRTDLNDFFAGFNQFIDAFLVHILTSLFMLVAFIFCIIPGFIVAGIYIYGYLFLIDRKLSFWDAMESSRKVAVGNLFWYTLFVILLLLVNLFGLLLAGVGLLITIPVSVAAVTVAYKETIGFAERAAEPRGPVLIP